MKLIKNGVTFDVKSDIQISAFLSSGYERADEDVIEELPEETTETTETVPEETTETVTEETTETAEAGENVEEKTKKRGAANGNSKQ